MIVEYINIAKHSVTCHFASLEIPNPMSATAPAATTPPTRAAPPSTPSPIPRSVCVCVYVCSTLCHILHVGGVNKVRGKGMKLHRAGM